MAMLISSERKISQKDFQSIFPKGVLTKLDPSSHSQSNKSVSKLKNTMKRNINDRDNFLQLFHHIQTLFVYQKHFCKYVY